jgi:hypothetical protein
MTLDFFVHPIDLSFCYFMMDLTGRPYRDTSATLTLTPMVWRGTFGGGPVALSRGPDSTRHFDRYINL